MRTIPRCCHAFWGWYKASAGRLAPWLQPSCSFGAPLNSYWDNSAQHIASTCLARSLHFPVQTGLVVPVQDMPALVG